MKRVTAFLTILGFLFTWNIVAKAEVVSPVAFRALSLALNMRPNSTPKAVTEMYRIHSAELTEVLWMPTNRHWHEARLLLAELKVLYATAFGRTAPDPDILDSRLEERGYFESDGDRSPPYTIHSSDNPNPLVTVLCQGLLTKPTRH